MTTKLAFEWKEPPPATQKGKKKVSMFDKIVDELIKNPNKWAKVAIVKNQGGVSPNLNRVAIRKNPNGEIDTTGRKQSDGTWEIYARWIPKEK